ILSILFLTVLFTALLTFSMKPLYRATARIIIDKETQSSPLTGQQLDVESYASQQLTFQTHFKIVTSRPVLEKVLSEINLSDEALERGLVRRFFSGLKGNVKSLLAIFPSTPKYQELLPQEERLLTEKIERLKRKIEIQEVRNTRLLNIHVEDSDPPTARNIANTLAETYIRYDSATRLESSRKMLDWLNRQLYGMKKKVEDSEKAFLAFKEQENLFSIEGKQKINVQKIEEMNAVYIDTRTQRLEVEAKIRALKNFIGSNKGSKIHNIPAFLKNDLIENLYVQLLNTEIDHQEISKVYKRKHPEMLRVTSKIQELSSKIRQQIKKTLTNAESERAVLIAREKALEEAMKRYEQEAMNTNRKELQYAIFERDVQTNRELYNTLLTKIKEADITDEITKTNLRLVAPAALPVKPVKPKKTMNLALGLILGLFTGVGLAFFLEYLDQTVHNREDAEEKFGLPVLSEIPVQDKNHLKPNKNGKYSVPSILELPLTSHFSEAFRMLVTNLKFSGLDRPKGVYLVTSSTPQEGKSTTCYNLALTMAHFGARTLIIDTDLRMPKMESILGVNVDKGLSNILVETFGTAISSGALGEWSVGDIHKLLEIQEKSGILSFENETNAFHVTFHKGRLVYVDWLTRPPEKRLGNLLVQSSKITKEQVQMALNKGNGSSERFGQILLHLGFMSPDELAGPLKLQIQEGIRELHNCKHARFSFQEDPNHVPPDADPKEAALRDAMGDLDRGSQHGTPYLLARVQECLVQVQDMNLWVLTSGSLPPNPVEFLASSRMRTLMSLLRDQFDLVLLDSPPVAAMSDAAILTPLCDGVIMIMRAGYTNLRDIKRGKEQLDAVQAPIIGTVLNMLDMKKDPYYGRNAYKYGYYYDKQEPKARGLTSRIWSKG
ncbi:MAG: DUF4388 domain-containing protein, partial [Deltaproteobacteria bacterium]